VPLRVGRGQGRGRGADRLGGTAGRATHSLADGVQSLRHPEPVTNVPVGVAVLLVSAGLEGLSWRTAHRQLRAEATARHLDLGEYVAVSSDPAPATVFLEDSAALVGLALALAALVLHLVTGSAVWDGAASLLIGLLLIGVAVVLMRRPRHAGRGWRPARGRRLSVPAVAAVEITPVERPSG
jgi:Cation efflux family